jgi:(p)ppGpp synthase/HD superfamily hydrolase
MNESANAMLERAIKVAVIAHAGQVDKNGEAYILHPLRVMLAVRELGGTPCQQAAAVLHDVLEDCDVSEDFLEQRLTREVNETVDALTHQDGEEYDDFLRRVARTPGALLIKEADIRDNHGRLYQVQDEATRRRLQAKYDSALELIGELRQSTEGCQGTRRRHSVTFVEASTFGSIFARIR